MEIILSKVCTGPCGLEKPLDQFHKQKRGMHGHAARCKSCIAERTADYRANPEVKQRRKEYNDQYQVEYRAKPENKKRQAEYNAGYHAEYYSIPENKQRKAKYNAEFGIAYRSRHEVKQRQAQYDAQYAKDHPEKNRVKHHRRRARLANAPGFMPMDGWNITLGFYGARCAQCGSKKKLTLDHVVPLSWGGENSLRNSQVLCLSHNCSKGDHRDTDYRDWNNGILAERIVT